MSSGEIFYQRYTEEFMNIFEIAEVYDCSPQYVSKCIIDAGYKIKIFPKKGNKDERIINKKRFSKIVKESKNCEDIGRKLGITAYVVRNWIKFHEIEHEFDFKGEGAASFKTGRTRDGHGYVWINAHVNKYLDFNPTYKSHQVLEQKFVMETKVLGFILPKGYVCHHIDGDKANNKIKNLALMSRAEHLWAHSLLNKIGKFDNLILKKQAEDILTTLVKGISTANINMFRIRHVLMHTGCHDELATIAWEQSKKEWKDRKHFNIKELLDKLI